MRALQLIVFGIVLALFALFSFANWTPVDVVMPSGSKVQMPLPVIVFAAFLLGWLPVLLVHVAARASWRRRTAKVERLLDDALTAPRTAAPAVAPPTTVFPPVT